MQPRYTLTEREACTAAPTPSSVFPLRLMAVKTIRPIEYAKRSLLVLVVVQLVLGVLLLGAPSILFASPLSSPFHLLGVLCIQVAAMCAVGKVAAWEMSSWFAFGLSFVALAFFATFLICQDGVAGVDVAEINAKANRIEEWFSMLVLLAGLAVLNTSLMFRLPKAFSGNNSGDADSEQSTDVAS